MVFSIEGTLMSGKGHCQTERALTDTQWNCMFFDKSLKPI
jgi:hypothetical protein